MADPYRPGADAAQVPAVLADRIRKTSLPVLVLILPVTFHLEPLLGDWAARLEDMGMTGGREVRRHDLLPLLSSPYPMTRAAAPLLQDLDRQDGLVLVDSFHRFSYSPDRTRELLDLLLRPPARTHAPLLLHVPDFCLPDILRLEPALGRLALRYPATGQARPPGAGQEGYSPRQPPGQQGSLPPNAPWYLRDPDLMKWERDGMTRCLTRLNLSGRLSALPQSRRLCWSVSLPVLYGGIPVLLPLRLIYSRNFSNRNPSVGVSLRAAAGPGIKDCLRRHSLKVVSGDPEAGEICLLDPGRPSPDGAAADALERARELLGQYGTYHPTIQTI